MATTLIGENRMPPKTDRFQPFTQNMPVIVLTEEIFALLANIKALHKIWFDLKGQL